MNISKYLNQTAIYWGNPVIDGYGNLSFDDPVEIRCRWQESNEEVLSKEGTAFVSHTSVLVGEDLDEGGYLMLGVLEDIAESASMSDSESESSVDYNHPSPEGLSDAFPIRVFQTIPDKRAQKYVRWARL